MRNLIYIYILDSYIIINKIIVNVAIKISKNNVII